MTLPRITIGQMLAHEPCVAYTREHRLSAHGKKY